MRQARRLDVPLVRSILVYRADATEPRPRGRAGRSEHSTGRREGEAPRMVSALGARWGDGRKDEQQGASGGMRMHMNVFFFLIFIFNLYFLMQRSRCSYQPAGGGGRGGGCRQARECRGPCGKARMRELRGGTSGMELQGRSQELQKLQVAQRRRHSPLQPVAVHASARAPQRQNRGPTTLWSH